MRKICYATVLAVFLSFSFLSASEFRVYPGSQVDEHATQEANEAAQAARMSNLKATIYTTPDSFQKVAAFYKGIAAEYMMPRASGTSGEPRKSDVFGGELWEAYFIFDGAKDLASSKLWIKIQRPYIGEEIRNVTAIVVAEKK
ncbi:MAG: hypothetical protein ACUVWY_13450 [Desulfosoma sp.]|uniref:hypothetical protein n=1 Tax=Desulfosoma sp. TaxID=2603217 RepID=UPI0040497C87